MTSSPRLRDPFQFLYPFGLRDGESKTREQMDVVFDAADEDGRAIELFGDAAEIRVQCVARGFVVQERSAVFGGEDQMNVNGGKPFFTPPSARAWRGIPPAIRPESRLQCNQSCSA